MPLLKKSFQCEFYSKYRTIINVGDLGFNYYLVLRGNYKKNNLNRFIFSIYILYIFIIKGRVMVLIPNENKKKEMESQYNTEEQKK